MRFSGLVPPYTLWLLLRQNIKQCWGSAHAFSISSSGSAKVRSTNRDKKNGAFHFCASSVETLEGLLHKEKSVISENRSESAIRSALLDLATTRKDQYGNDNTTSTLESEPATGTGSNIDEKENIEFFPSIQERFIPLLGNYKVLYTLPNKPNERPVGGKWTRGGSSGGKNALFSLLGSWQHLAQPKQKDSVAQVINLITLRALFLQITVLLRGDAYPLTAQQRLQIATERQTPYGGLSDRTVRADFDPPRIFLKRFLYGNKSSSNTNRVLLGLSIGPPSSVVLDTPYSNEQIRLGKGSRGSLFVFGRTHDSAVQAEWSLLVDQKLIGQAQLFAFSVTVTTCLGILMAWMFRASWSSWWQRLLVAPLFAASLLSTAVVAFSSGGIERDRAIKRAVAEEGHD